MRRLPAATAKVTFTLVGYGLQQSFPDAVSYKDPRAKTRYVAHPRLIQINVPRFTGDFSMLQPSKANTGGTCFGDSGGASFALRGIAPSVARDVRRRVF